MILRANSYSIHSTKFLMISMCFLKYYSRHSYPSDLYPSIHRRNAFIYIYLCKFRQNSIENKSNKINDNPFKVLRMHLHSILTSCRKMSPSITVYHGSIIPALSIGDEDGAIYKANVMISLLYYFINIHFYI